MLVDRRQYRSSAAVVEVEMIVLVDSEVVAGTDIAPEFAGWAWKPIFAHYGAFVTPQRAWELRIGELALWAESEILRLIVALGWAFQACRC